MPAVVPAHIDETRHPDEPPATYVHRLALEKARAVAHGRPGAFVLAADTTVALGDLVLNKPRDRVEAATMLRRLAGQTHQVHTGVALLTPGHEAVHVESTLVEFTPIPEPELQAYLATGDSLDKAGAYAIQGFAARWVASLHGDYTNVVGLPLAAVVRLLRAGAPTVL